MRHWTTSFRLLNGSFHLCVAPDNSSTERMENRMRGIALKAALTVLGRTSCRDADICENADAALDWIRTGPEGRGDWL